MKPRRVVPWISIAIFVAGAGAGLAAFLLPKSPSPPIEFPTELLPLQIPLEQSVESRAALVETFQAQQVYQNRELIESVIDEIGANGVVQSFTDAYQGMCHDEAHDFGRVLFDRLQNVGDAFAACENVCQSGCMHGVTMEFLATKGDTQEVNAGADAHVGAEDLLASVDLICDARNLTADYKLGDCVHGVGHALMFLADYDVDEAIGSCEGMSTDVLDYYCATGAYMEYVTTEGTGDKGQGTRDSGTMAVDGLFGLCGQAEYPAACFRYQMPNNLRTYYTGGGTFNALVNRCLVLDGTYEAGCFHGIGNGHLQFVVSGEVRLDQLCANGDVADQYVCIEGLMERLARYYPELVEFQCASVSGWQKDVCEASAKRQLYDLDKPFEHYVK